MDKLDRDEGCALLQQMMRIRRFEEKCAELYGAGKIRGFLHLYIGEEAIASAICRSFAPTTTCWRPTVNMDMHWHAVCQRRCNGGAEVSKEDC